MKYVVLIYSNPRTWEEMPAAERDRALGVHNASLNNLRETGELIRVDGLASAAGNGKLRLPVAETVPLKDAIHLITALEAGRKLSGKALVAM